MNSRSDKPRGDSLVPVAARAGQPARPCGAASFFAGTALEDREDWYGKHLGAMGERPLCADERTAVERYRLTWLPTFHPGVVVRVERDSAGYRLVAKTETGAGGYEPGELAKETTRMLSPAEQRELARLLALADFWSLPTLSPYIGLDGAQWILEGLAGGRYHVVDRWTPDRNGPDARYRGLAEWLLAASGLTDASLHRGY